MKGFKQFIAERTIDMSSALKIMGLPTLPDENNLKKAYKKMSMKHHPDKGGSTAMMQDVNLAYDYLIKAIPNSSQGSRRDNGVDDWLKKMAPVMRDEFKRRFDPKRYADHFREYAGKNFTWKMGGTPKGNTFKKYDTPHYAGVQITFTSEDKETIFNLDINLYLINLYNSGGSLGGGNKGVNLYVTTYGFHNNRKLKVSKRDWSISDSDKIFTDPNVIYPKAKMKRMFSAKSTAKASKRFAKRDADLFLRQKLGATSYKENYKIPLGDDYILVIYRVTMMRTPFWMPNGLYLKHRRVDLLKTVSIGEMEPVFLELQKTVNKAKKAVGEKAMVKILDDGFEKMKDMSLKIDKSTR